MTFRYARHTQDLEQIKRFYQDIIGLDIISSFKDHDGYDGLFFSKGESNWHLEFTASKRLPIHSFDLEDALVFYPTSLKEWNIIIANLERENIPHIDPENPYWKEFGIQIKDPDGAYVIISNQKVKD